MYGTIRKKGLAILLTLAMAISFMPAMTMPVHAAGTTLSAGDNAFVMLNLDANPMTWAWVPLVDIESGTTIYFTDILPMMDGTELFEEECTYEN